MLATETLCNCPHQQREQGDEHQALDGLIAAHIQGVDEEWAFHGSKAFLHPILTFEQGQCLLCTQVLTVRCQRIAAVQGLSFGQALTVERKVQTQRPVLAGEIDVD